MSSHDSTTPRPTRIAIASKLLKSIGYDPQTQALEVEFSSGSIYTYLDVTPETYAALMDADSVGAHFLRDIKPHHAFTRMDV